MYIFADTSAFYALVDKSDQFHETATESLTKILQNEIPLFTSNYIIVETISLLQRRIGMDAVKVFINQIIPTLKVEWINFRIHQKTMSKFLRINRRKLSFVDCSSFVIMEENHVEQAFANDKHFEDNGFRLFK